MRKRFIKIICGAVAMACTFGAMFAAGCTKSVQLSGIEFTEAFEKMPAKSNGGFAVTKGDYVYFINGVQSNTADNAYGEPEKGAIYRISTENFAKHSYAEVDCVVPHVAFNFDYDTGLFIYGNYIYFATPSVNRDSEGNVYSDVLDLKRAKLDGTEVSDAYIQLPKRDSDKKYEYRFVQEDDGTVYILYVSTDEKLEGSGTAAKNLHSFNISMGVDTVLASGVEKVIFDNADKSNPRVFYTMKVKNYSAGEDYSYNQVYTVTAKATEDKFKDKLSSEVIVGWDDDEDLYINCGELVFDGVGYMNELTPFNYAYGKENVEQEAMRSAYTYDLIKYQDGVLFYTRKSSSVSKSNLFELKVSDIGKDNKTPLTLNADKKKLLTDGGSASAYTYFVENEELKYVLYCETAGISVNKVVNGELQTEISDMDSSAPYYKVVQEGACSILFTDNNYLYYSVNGDSGYTFYRIDYTGNSLDYDGDPNFNDSTGTDDYTPVKILDLVSVSDWYKPELIENQLIYASMADGDYYAANYITAFDLRGYNPETGAYGEVMSNKQLADLNESYNEMTAELFGKDEKDDGETYAHLTDAYKYLFRTGDIEYIEKLAAACNAELEEDATPVYSDKTLEKLKAFLAPSADNEWSGYTATKKVNGRDVKANTSEYYYSIVGKVTEEDGEAFAKGLKDKLLQAMPAEKGWYESLSQGEKIGFIVGMCVLGVLVIGGAVALTVILVKRNKKSQPAVREKRIKVDTYDDKNIDVYGTGEDAESTEETTK